MTPTRGLPFAADPPGSASSSTASGSASSAASARCAATSTSPRRSAASTSPQSASSAGVHSTTRLCVAASGESGAAGPDMSMTASCARGRKPAASTAAPRSTCVSPRPTGIAGPSNPGNTPPPPGPLEQGWTASSTPTIRTESPGRGAGEPDLGERGVAEEVAHALLADGEAPRVVARALAQRRARAPRGPPASARPPRSSSGSFQMSATARCASRRIVRGCCSERACEARFEQHPPLRGRSDPGAWP